MANRKIQDTYYLETSLNGTGSVIIIANDQLSDMHTWDAYLLSFLPEIVSAAVRWLPKTFYHDFKNRSAILAVF